MTEADGRDVTIDSKLYERIQGRVEVSEFKDVDSYVEFVLEELLRHLEDPGETKVGQDEEVRDRLQELGYLE